MWAQYANNFSGICLVYSFFDVLETIKHTKGMSIMPVRYVDNRDKYKDICLNHKDLLEFNDETEPKYQLTCTTKEKLSYSFEEEWRLIYEREKVNTDGIREKYRSEAGSMVPAKSLWIRELSATETEDGTDGRMDGDFRFYHGGSRAV